MKPRIRVMSDGTLFRLWLGGFGAMFVTGPYNTLAEALSYRDFFLAASACGYAFK